MPSRDHLGARAADVADCATLEIAEKDGWEWITLRPTNPGAAPVLLYVGV